MELGDVVEDRFELEDVAGSGAFGRVFRARDRKSGGLVAIKILEEARREVVERFKREVELLASVEHEGIVRHVASGVASDRYSYLAMEWLEGQDLSRRLAKGPLAAAELLSLARSLGAGLDAAHVLGIVHRDVKPGNVWLVGGDAARAKLLDFGLARLAAQSSLTRVGTFLGTPEYMAPEQVKGAASLDQRADLFSLGCLLYECAQGKTPFAAPTPLAVATRVLLDEPPRLDELRDDVPPAFAELVDRLLAKVPDKRPTRAEALALLDRAFEQQRAGFATFATEPDPTARLRAARDGRAVPAGVSAPRVRVHVPEDEAPLARRPAGATLPALPADSRAISSAQSSLLGRAPPFVGRDDALERLSRVFDACVREKVIRPCLVEGPAGSGKSRLLREFLSALTKRALPLVVVLRGEASRRGEPFGALARATSEALGLPPSTAGADALRADLTVALAPRLPASHGARVAAFFGELLGAPFPDDAHPLLAAARAEGARTGDQIARAWADWLDAELHQRPVLLVLDDAPSIDPPSIDVVAGAVRQLTRRRMMVVSALRPGSRGQLPEALVGPRPGIIEVGPLPREASERIVVAALGDRATPPTVAAILERSEGLPLHLEELIRAAASGIDVARPHSLEAMVLARLQGLEASVREVVEAAAVLGQAFDEAGVASLLERRVPASQVSAAIDRLVELELLAEGPARQGEVDGRQLGFRHALVRDTAYAGVGDSRRSALHGRAARWLARTGPWAPAVIAEHLVRAGEAEAARAFFRRAAVLAIESNDFAGAIASVERALEAGAAAEELGQLRLLQAEASRHLADNEGMFARATEAHGTLPVWSRPWSRAASLAVLAAVRLGRPEAIDALEPALAEGADRGDLPASAARTAHYLFFAGRHELADRLLGATGEASDAEPDRDAWVARACATRALLAGDVSTYLEHLDHAISVFEEVGDVREQAAERVNAGFARMELGLWRDAEATLRSALEGAERAGLRHVEAVARVNLGEALFRMGRPTDALACLDAAVGALRRQGNRRMEGNARLYRARLHLAGGELEAAERDAESAVEALRHVPPLMPLALAVSAQVQLAARQVDRAGTSAREAVRRADEEARLDEGEGFVRLVGIDVALAKGDNEEAWRELHVARRRLLERAGRVAREDWRQSFLQVPEHARTLQLFAAWSAAAPAGPVAP